MKTIVIFLICAAVGVSARWSLYTAKASKADDDHMDHDDLDWWENGVFYQIYPRSFKDSDNDGEGDLKGVLEKLDHLKDLGITGTWLSPIFKSPMVDGGYDIADFKTVDPRFGSNADLKAIFAKGKELGIKIILDFVPNHTSDKHEWFVESRKDKTNDYHDWYVWKDCEEIAGTSDRKLPNNWRAVFHTPAWSYDSVRGQCYLHQFTKEQPDLNYRNPKVREAMIETLKFWLEEGADGYRIDAINHAYEVEDFASEIPIDPNGDLESYDNYYHNHTMNLPESYQFIYDVRDMMDKFVKEKNDNMTRLMMTEAYASIEEQVLWYGKDDKRGSHIPFNFMLISNLNKDSKAKNFEDAINTWVNAMPVYGEANWVMGNHDRSRIGSRYGAERHEGLAIMTMMLPGVNVVYYGEEILMVDNCDISWEQTDDPQAKNTNSSYYLTVTRDPVRTPMQWDDSTNAGFSGTTGDTWLPIHANYKTKNVKAQKEAEKSTLKLYKSLIEMRKSYHQLSHGGLYTKSVNENVFGFVRTLADHDSLAVFLNLGSATKVSLKNLIDEKEWSDKMEGKILIVNNESKLKIGEMVNPLEIELGAYDAVVLQVSSSSKFAISAVLLLIVSLIKFLL